MRKVIILTVIGILMSIGAVAYAGHVFNDVPSDHTFHSDIEWGFENGLTFGCNPASGGDLMCPDDPVTRGQMMAFFHRYDENLDDGGENIDEIINEVIVELPDDLQGPTGPEGPQGEQGEQGPQGEPGVANLVRVEEDQVFSGGGFGWATCPDGLTVIGGGFYVHGVFNDTNPDSFTNGTAVMASLPVLEEEEFNWGPGEDQTVTVDANSWLVRPNKPSGVNPGDITVYALCATVGS